MAEVKETEKTEEEAVEAVEETVEEKVEKEEEKPKKETHVEHFRGIPVDKILESGDEELIEAYKDKYSLE